MSNEWLLSILMYCFVFTVILKALKTVMLSLRFLSLLHKSHFQCLVTKFTDISIPVTKEHLLLKSHFTQFSPHLYWYHVQDTIIYSMQFNK